MEKRLTTTFKIKPSFTWYDYKHHNTVEFLVSDFLDSTIILSNVYTRRSNDKAILL